MGGITASVRKDDRLGHDRRQRRYRIGPIGLDDGKSPGAPQRLKDIGRWTVGNDDKRTLQRHGGLPEALDTLYFGEPCQNAVNGVLRDKLVQEISGSVRSVASLGFLARFRC